MQLRGGRRAVGPVGRPAHAPGPPCRSPGRTGPRRIRALHDHPARNRPGVPDGPGERRTGLPLLVAIFIAAGVAAAAAWTTAQAPPTPARSARHRGWTLVALAGFVLVGMYLGNGFLDALDDFPTFVEERAATSEYDEHPTTYWIVAFLDLAVVIPVTMAAALALLRGRPWADRPFYAVIGWYALVPLSVTAMAVTMVARDDPAADEARAVVFAIASVVFLALAALVFAPLPRQKGDHQQPI